MSEEGNDCELCRQAGGELLWQNSLCRVVLVDEVDYPGFCRVILNRHVKEMTDLDAASRVALMEVVFGVELALREEMAPEKINLASLGNMTPHVHWHVIPRFRMDRHFPAPIWAPARREVKARATVQLADKLRARLNTGLAGNQPA